MKIAVLSGKGGAGKTFLAVNLAASIGEAVYVDCDVEEPNGALFLNGKLEKQSLVYRYLPVIDGEKCDGCRQCVDFCRFHAMVQIKDQPKIFGEICHSCGGRMLVCPQKAISEQGKVIGQIEERRYGDVEVITGVLHTGEASGIPVMEAAMKKGEEKGDPVIIDCPPGSACSVMACVDEADYCILVAEPTAFGFHNFRMVHELVTLLGKPCGVVINKEEEPYLPLEEFCRRHQIPVLMRIPYTREIARASAGGQLLVGKERKDKQRFREIYEKIGGERT